MRFTVIIPEYIYCGYSLIMIVLNKETRENDVGDDGVIKNIKYPIPSGFSWVIQFIRIFMSYSVHKSSHPIL